MKRPESNLAVASRLASSTPEHPWPSFDGTKLPLSQPARQQLSRVYRNNSRVAQRKSNLLRWIQSSAFDPIKGIHLPVSEIVETNAAAALNQSKNFAREALNFPEMPPVPRFFSNAFARLKCQRPIAVSDAASTAIRRLEHPAFRAIPVVGQRLFRRAARWRKDDVR